MILHTNSELFKLAIKEVSEAMKIRASFVEKDYWISLALQNLSDSKYYDSVVFKGGTSLSKGHKLIKRFSEDIDLAVINSDSLSGSSIKKLIRAVEKEVAFEMTEVEVAGVTSKGSRFRKSVYNYPTIEKGMLAESNSIIVEVNSFANPFPFAPQSIQSFIGEYLQAKNQEDIVKQYGLESFKVNVLAIEQTLIEKLVSLIRFSFSENPINGISSKIRHFYDLYYILQDERCKEYVRSSKFKEDFDTIFEHDKELFDEPKGWRDKKVSDSPLITSFEELWTKLKTKYTNELSALAFAEIPSEERIEEKIVELLRLIR